MPDDDLGYLLRRSNDERKRALEAADLAVRSAHGRMADRYAEKAARLLIKTQTQ
jgi:hypothetical protein